MLCVPSGYLRTRSDPHANYTLDLTSSDMNIAVRVTRSTLLGTASPIGNEAGGQDEKEETSAINTDLSVWFLAFICGGCIYDYEPGDSCPGSV